MENEDMNRNEDIGVNLSNDYVIEEDSASLVGIKKRPHDIRNPVKMILAVFWFHGAVMEGPEDLPQHPTPARIAREIKAANSIWRTPDGSNKIEFLPVRYLDAELKIINVDAETLSDEKITAIMSLGNDYYPSADCFVFYIPGDKFSDGSFAKAYKRYINSKEIYFIIISNGARARIEDGTKKGQDYILAHELGHIMYFSNYHGNTSDPNPNGSDIGHHNDDTPEEKRNLMCPTLIPNGQIPTITEAQVKKALQSKLFLN
ncbi:MAG: hypothetical protein ACQEWW_27020 [Bacillota bacterium]